MGAYLKLDRKEMGREVGDDMNSGQLGVNISCSNCSCILCRYQGHIFNICRLFCENIKKHERHGPHPTELIKPRALMLQVFYNFKHAN